MILYRICEWDYAVCHINPIKMSFARRVCITVRRWVLQNRDHAQPPFSTFFVSSAKKISLAAVATPRVTGFADLYFSEFG